VIRGSHFVAGSITGRTGCAWYLAAMNVVLGAGAHVSSTSARPLVVAGLLVAALILGACGGTGGTPPVAKAGDTVEVHYTGTLDDGTQFDSSKGRDPLTFTVGAGQVIPGFDKAVIGLEVGTSIKVHIPPEEAYGERRQDLVLTFPAAQAPAGLKVGQRVSLGNGSGVVTALSSESVTVDANHELAGKALNFELELVAIKPPA